MRGVLKAKVTEQGVVIPKGFLEKVENVEIRKEEDLILIVPITRHDPILDLGKRPVACGAQNASVHHDKYVFFDLCYQGSIYDETLTCHSNRCDHNRYPECTV